MTTLHKFSNLLNLLTYFKDEQVCLDYLETIRWNGSLECVYKDCDGKNIYRCANRKLKCDKCRRIYSIKVGTIFEGSKLPLQKWYAGIYLITAHKKGISSLQLSRDLSITQKSAWFLLHRVRYALGLKLTDEKLKGIIEADETFIGGKEENKHKHKRTKGTQGRSVKTKSAVAGLVQRGGELRAVTVPDTSTLNVGRNVLKNVEFGSVLYTDEWYAYNQMGHWFQHKFVKHNEGKYVDGATHTNTLEGFWSLLKRGIVGIYHSVSDKHLQRYVDEFTFRYNTRTDSSSLRFDTMMNNICSRLTYNNLINGNKGNNRKVEFEQKSLGF